MYENLSPEAQAQVQAAFDKRDAEVAANARNYNVAYHTERADTILFGELAVIIGQDPERIAAVVAARLQSLWHTGAGI